MRGRPRKSNDELLAQGSRNGRVAEIDSEVLSRDAVPPQFLPLKAVLFWFELLRCVPAPKLADVPLLAHWADLNERYYDRTIDPKTKLPTVDEKERARISKQIFEISDKFGMNPLSRSRSGVSKKTLQVKQRPG